MGKRELVLIAVFAVLGFGVYQVTAPPPPPGSEGISLSGIFRNMKRGIQGARETATADSRETVPVDPAVHDLRINIPRTSDITVTGEDRDDIATELHATGRGFDQAEAKVVASAAKMKVERVGDAIVVSVNSPAVRNARSNSVITQMVIAVKVPRRLSLRMEPHSGPLIVSNLATAELMGSRGDTRVSKVMGRLQLTHSGGTLDVDEVPSLKLNARNSRATITHVTGPVTIDAIGGELTLSDVTGPLEIEGRNTELRMTSITALKGPLRVNTTGGEVQIDGLRTEARLDGRNTAIEVILAAPAPVTIYNLGDIRVTAPTGGYALDAAATEGRLNLEDGDLKPSEGNDPHVSAPVRGGGPPITLRSTRGSITVRKAAGKYPSLQFTVYGLQFGVLSTAPLLETSFPDLKLHGRGKVRDIYQVGAESDDVLLLVATDRISAFDYVLGSGIPDKGKVLTQLSAFWFERMGDLVPHHVIATDVAAYPAALQPYAAALRGRSMLCRRTRPLPIECVARGYLSGSGWKEYQQTGSVCGVQLPPGLRESDRLPEPIFTPATKAETGHDINISEDEAAKIVGRDLVQRVKTLTLEIFARGSAHAESKGIIIADTKFEFGLVRTGDPATDVVLIDEVLTPDSSRFWPKDAYRPGGAVPSFDKQYVRDYLEEIRWNKQPPVPSLPEAVVLRTREKYVEAFRRLSDRDLQ